MPARVLYVTKFAPSDRPSGGVLRTTRLLAALRSRYDVTVLGYVERGEPAPRGRVSSLGRSLLRREPYQVARYDTPWLRGELERELRERPPDAIHVEYVNQTPLVWESDLPLVVDLPNVESALSAGIADSSSGVTRVLARRDARLLCDVEPRVAERASLITVVSADEATRVEGNVHVVANGIDPTRVPVEIEREPWRFVFTGLFSWQLNIAGAQWFVSEVLPLLPAQASVQLVGRDPDRSVRKLGSHRVEVTGEVPDAWPYICGASVIVAPLLAPGGTRFKILEGLLAGRPVVATPQAADGLSQLQGDGLVLADSPAAFAERLVELANDPAAGDALGRRGRERVIADFDWQISCDRLLALYDEYVGI